MNFIITILILFVMLGLIISIHEFGHFIAAKKCGVYVDEFSIGMGPLIYKHKPKNSETTYSLRLLPIGGYVSMAEKADPKLKIKKDKILENKNFFQTFWVLINGITFNFLLAIVLFFISGLAYGRPEQLPIIDEVSENSPAYVVGLEHGDKIISVNDVKTKTLYDFRIEVSGKKAKDSYTFKVEKADGSIATYEISPEVKKDKDGNESRVFGVVFNKVVYHKGFKEALKYGITGFAENFVTIWKILGSLITGEVSVKNLSGPVGIYSMVDEVKTQGLQTLLFLTAYLSINVGIVNLIPITVFDGGRIVILIIEKIIGRKTNDKLENILNYVGFGLMILLMIFVTINDVLRLI